MTTNTISLTGVVTIENFYSICCNVKQIQYLFYEMTRFAICPKCNKRSYFETKSEREVRLLEEKGLSNKDAVTITEI